MNAIEIKKDIHWVGALDPNLRIFDIIMYTPYGTTYNSYLVKGSEKTAIFETVKEKFFDEFLERLNSLNTDIKDIDYIIVDHTEPDHAGSVAKLLDLAPKAKLVGSSTALRFMRGIVNREFDSITVNHGDTLSLGNKTLQFISAPFLHWPDSMYTYIVEDNLLVTCDSFGCHYSNKDIFNDLNESQENYMDALKYYFTAIMGPFKSYVLDAIDKIKDLNIDIICPGHGPILRDNPSKIIKLYKEWSLDSEKSSESKYIVIPYVSAYGYTESLAKKIEEGIHSIGGFKVELFDVIHHNINDIVSSIEKSHGVIFGSPTINGDALKPILDILISLNPIVHGRKTAAAFGSYGWSGEAVSNIENRLKQLKMDIFSPGLRVNFKPSEEDLTHAYHFGQSFAQKIDENISKINKPNKPSTSKKWKCLICGVVFEGTEPPETCSVCGASSEQFVEVVESGIEFRNDDDKTYLIIGNGAAGFSAADTIRKRNKNCKIIMVSSENNLTYFRPQLSDYLSSSIPDNEFYVVPERWYKDNNIDLCLNSYVDKINGEDRKIILSDGRQISYDKLILANGSSSFVPPIKGIDKKGVFSLKYLSDADAIKNYISSSKKAVVIGGGLLGLEAAWELKKCGLDVTVVEFANRLLSRQLDEEGAKLFNASIDKSGVSIILQDSAVEILGDEKVTGVMLTSGKTVDADIVIFSIGIRPNKALADTCGIKADKGIVVNDKMETSVENVYACGDVCEYNGKVYGNWQTSIEMGKTAGANAVGDESYFTDFVSSVIFSAMDTELFSCGTFTSESKALSSLDSQKGIYQKLFFNDNKLIGGILLGDTKKSGKIISAIQSGKTIKDIMSDNFFI